jgi:hypothetical protein
MYVKFGFINIAHQREYQPEIRTKRNNKPHAKTSDACGFDFIDQ